MNSLLTHDYLCDELKANPLDHDNLMIARDWCVYEHESRINRDKTLYMYTWSPDPDDLPNCDFTIQHDSCIATVVNFTKSCELCLTCVEASAKGNPHYHGWYQKSADTFKNQIHVAMLKTMQQTGNFKVDKSRGHMKIHSYVKAANCLYYYKKELLDESLYITVNPITEFSVPEYTISDFSTFFSVKGKRQTVADIEKSASLQQFYKDFYMKSID